MFQMNAARAINPIPNGVTKPYYVSCTDNEIYVVKFAQNPYGVRVLVNEYVCAKIAQDLLLPYPMPALINVPSVFIEDHGTMISNHVGDEINEGLHFGTHKIKKVYQVTSPKMIAEASNIDIVPEILLFDQFICNSDRDNNGGNLLFNPSSMEIMIIDHTHAFDLGSIWSAQQLRIRLGQSFEIYNLNGYVYKNLVPFIDGYNPFHNILGKIAGMTDERLWHIINSVPDEWSVNEDEKIALTEYLIDRRNRIEQVPPLMRSNLPYWKGGE